MSDKPPFRADQVGSLLRPPEIKQAWADLAAGRLAADALTAVENAAVDRVIAKQEAAGLKSVTDGEIRRHTWLGDFFFELDGTVAKPVEIKGADGTTVTITIPAVTGKIGFSGHPMLEHFKYLAAHTNKTPKVTLPAPAMLVSALRDWRQIVDPDVYPDVREFYHDLGLAYRGAVSAFYAAGCRYLQLDDVNLAYLCDPSARARIEARGDDPDALLSVWVETVNTAIEGRPDDMVITTHICRGNFRSTWLAEGGYEPVADVLFNQYDYDGYFLEYDSDRAGGFEPLRFVPDGNKFVMLGLITTKTGALEDKYEIEARIEAASKFVPIDRLGLSPQCGFASTEEGNIITEDEQWAKLAHVAKIAADVWPDA
ncbi:MAG TPA: 5-methyltetrahydropteroyltriglutamate--homocysteine S-methyltransferase [Gammaproteobacteria bacterium]|nr:5-methyltetrahydropteroyltriglutamate--homocysteine S-methyltransferase [Gammaproteobacteria bacterium]